MLQIISDHILEIFILASIPISVMLKSLLGQPDAWRKHRSTLWLVGLNVSLLASLTALNYTGTTKIKDYVMQWDDDDAPVIMDAQLAHKIPPPIPELAPPDPKPDPPTNINLKKEIIIETTPDIIETDLAEIIDDIIPADPQDHAVLEPTIAPDLPPVEDDPEEIVVWAQHMPRFPGCEELSDKVERAACADKKLLQFIASHVQYTELARSAGISGTAVVQFVVTTTGRIEQIEIVRDPGGGLGKEAVAAVAAMNDMDQPWIAGSNGRRPVSVRYTLPIRFTNQ